jgi:hypothetical protein
MPITGQGRFVMLETSFLERFSRSIFEPKNRRNPYLFQDIDKACIPDL